jgi:hypothetical protein
MLECVGHSNWVKYLLESGLSRLGGKVAPFRVFHTLDPDPSVNSLGPNFSCRTIRLLDCFSLGP